MFQFIADSIFFSLLGRLLPPFYGHISFTTQLFDYFLN